MYLSIKSDCSKRNCVRVKVRTNISRRIIAKLRKNASHWNSNILKGIKVTMNANKG